MIGTTTHNLCLGCVDTLFPDAHLAGLVEEPGGIDICCNCGVKTAENLEVIAPADTYPHPSLFIKDLPGYQTLSTS